MWLYKLWYHVNVDVKHDLGWIAKIQNIIPVIILHMVVIWPFVKPIWYTVPTKFLSLAIILPCFFLFVHGSFFIFPLFSFLISWMKHLAVTVLQRGEFLPLLSIFVLVLKSISNTLGLYPVHCLNFSSSLKSDNWRGVWDKALSDFWCNVKFS